MSKFQKPYDNERIICTLCKHYCKLKEGQTGICGVNQNSNGEMECLVYGYPTALAVDPVEKKPLYHFFPDSKSLSIGTVGCNFHCSFCQNWTISQTSKIDKSIYYSPQKIVELAIENNCQSISYTYNEPTIFYPYARDIALEAKKHNIKNIFVTDGYESEEVINDMIGIIDAVNVDLKAFNEQYYKKELGGELNKVLDGLKLFAKHNIWLEITTLLVPGKNDSEEEVRQIAQFIANELGVHVPWHISAFHPSYKENNLPSTSLESLKKAYDIGKEAGLQHIYMGNIGVENHTLCPSCKMQLIERKAFGVGQNKLQNSNQCPNCDYKIEGVFYEQ